MSHPNQVDLTQHPPALQALQALQSSQSSQQILSKQYTHTIPESIKPTHEAWEILHNPMKVADSNELQILLTTLGICEGEDLLLCQLEEIQNMAATLKKVPQRRFMQIFEQCHMFKYS